MTKELSKICKFFVVVCLSILFSRDKSSLILSQDTLLKLRTVLFRNVLHKLKIFRESKFRDNLSQGCFDLKFMIVRDEII
jgi:hypothetical protein